MLCILFWISKNSGIILATLFFFTFLTFVLEKPTNIKVGKGYWTLKLSKKIEEYATTFTVHGLSRIYIGNATEKCLWTIFVVFALVVNGYVLTHYVTKYQKHDVYQSLSYTSTTQAYYPQITFCLFYREVALAYFKEKTMNLPNTHYIWSNNVFILRQRSPSNKSLLPQFVERFNYVISHKETNGTCITWHNYKKLYQNLFSSENSFILLDLLVPKVQRGLSLISLTVNEQSVSGIHQNPHLLVFENRWYQLTFSKTVIIRKPYPFPSRCTFKTKQHKFPGLYNQQVCKFVENDTKLIQKFPNQVQSCPLACEESSFYFSTTIISNIKPCYIDIAKLEKSDGSFPCGNKDNETKVEFVSYRFLLSYQHPEVYTTIEEKELYPKIQMIGEIGGFFGLMIGASCLSLLELVICIILVAAKRIWR